MIVQLAITFYLTKEISIANINLYFGCDLFIQPHYADEISPNYNIRVIYISILQSQPVLSQYFSFYIRYSLLYR